MGNPAVTIDSASQGVCLLCGSTGPVFEITTRCGRASALPVCAKDLFAIASAENRAGGSNARGPTRGRVKTTAKSMGECISGSTESESISEGRSASSSDSLDS